MSMWFGEYRDSPLEPWKRASKRAQKTQERAKADCKAFLEKHRQIGHQLEFRTVADDERGTVYQESRPPHGLRMRWADASW